MPPGACIAGQQRRPARLQHCPTSQAHTTLPLPLPAPGLRMKPAHSFSCWQVWATSCGVPATTHSRVWALLEQRRGGVE